jgi:hypothetical protein
MKQSTCVKCGGRIFEANTMEVHNLKYRPVVLQCAKCGGCIGAIDRRETFELLGIVTNKLHRLEKFVTKIWLRTQ